MKKIQRSILTGTEKDKIKKLRKQIIRWGYSHKIDFAWRKKPTPYSILMAEIFLQRTKAKQAEVQFKLFLKKYPSFQRLRSSKIRDLEKYLIPLGLKKRVKLLYGLIRSISKDYKERIPENYDSLIKLPGVGDYTANAIIIFALNKSAGLVDSNTIKIFSALFGLKITREEGKRSKFIKSCAEYYSSLGNPRISNWLLLDYAKNKASYR